jgi:hypothetical protein
MMGLVAATARADGAVGFGVGIVGVVGVIGVVVALVVAGSIWGVGVDQVPPRVHSNE